MPAPFIYIIAVIRGRPESVGKIRKTNPPTDSERPRIIAGNTAFCRGFWSKTGSYCMIACMNASPSEEKTDDTGPPIEVLIVDNDEAHAEVVSESLDRVGFRCRVATSGTEGAEVIGQAAFDVVITDLKMNDVDGLGILARTKSELPDAEVILMTGHGTVPSAVEAMQQGAFNYLLKPLDLGQLRAITEKAAESARLRRANVELKRRLDEKFGFEGVIGDSPQMRDVIERLKRIAPTNASVLIQGETGTGKELVAQAIHQNSPRKNKAFVALNCAALSENILESELFGHVKGAFTDASEIRIRRRRHDVSR